MTCLRVTAIPGIPLIEPGDDVAALTLRAMQDADVGLANGDVLVFAQKVISKAEGCYAYLNEIDPSPEARELAQRTNKDPRLVELILTESTAVLRHRPGVIIVEHRCGFVHANAGIDQSNINSDPTNPRVLLLPLDCDASAQDLHEAIQDHSGQHVNVIINDSAGRAWRTGTVGMALGTAGFEPLQSLIGEEDLFARTMQVTEVAVADELAAAASYLMGQAAEGRPVVRIRGAKLKQTTGGSQCLIRDKDSDLFR